MKQTLNLEQKALKFTELKALNEQELRETEGGFFGINWGMFWRGVGWGTATGAAGAAAYYA